MRTTRVLIIVALAAPLALPLAARSEEGGWKLPNLNPFSRPAGPPTSARTSSGSGLKMPSLWTKSGSKTAAKPKGPSTWQKMTNGTKSVVSKTADALNPFDDANDKVQQPTLVTGSKNKFRQASAQKKSESGSLWPSWLGGGQEEPARPKTVNDFLNQPRLQPE